MNTEKELKEKSKVQGMDDDLSDKHVEDFKAEGGKCITGSWPITSTLQMGSSGTQTVVD
jgi:hypothetical protein